MRSASRSGGTLAVLTWYYQVIRFFMVRMVANVGVCTGVRVKCVSRLAFTCKQAGIRLYAGCKMSCAKAQND
eukprot:scaffold203220_cov17-Tisochrysis_lutea.AAC.2